jgi:Tol biopolymer transport system component/tRNA A-37 threonylcarbamoyl transferase component Bud32
MALTAGTKLGAYEIVAPIGAGGMGTVYRARDTRLPRDAAIKVSAQKFSERFTSEAHAIASLNHPNITTLYDIGPDYLVMELVEGSTLAERIAQGPLPLNEASAIARQIADALDYAHERGIVHRDLKPGNVKIRPDGVVKVLDFGLAKSVAHLASQSDDSPTMAAPRTEAGMIVGTAAYMAPEQITGRDVDKRADIWAFGCVFYEMLTGRAAYRADTSQETMASILRDEPDLTKVPAQARRLLKRCLEKDPPKRLRHIGDVMALLDEPPSGESAALTEPTVPATISRRRWLSAAAAAGVIVIGGALAVWALWRPQESPVESVRFEVGPSEGMQFFYGGAMAVSPDGRWMVFPAIGDDGVARYWIRSLGTVEARPLPGTETAYVPAAWSWDSRYVFFNTLNSQQLRRVDIEGGPPQTLADAGGGLNGLASSESGGVVFGTTGVRPLFRIPAGGGTPAPITALAAGETGHKFPKFLPDGRHFLYLRVSPNPDVMGVYVGSIDARPEEQSSTRLLATNRQSYFASTGGETGHLIFLRETALMAQPFDAAALRLSGEATPIAQGVDSFPAQAYGLFDVSSTGTLVYRGGGGGQQALVWFDETGTPGKAIGDAAMYGDPALSPDQTRIAVARGTSPTRDIVIVDAAGGNAPRFTFDPADDFSPVWSPDGRSIVFASNRSGQPMMYIKPSDGSSEERLLTDVPGVPTSWSGDGRFLLFTRTSPKTATDLWAMRDPRIASETSKPFPILETQFVEQAGQFSPDGRWIAYMSNESSVMDVYVRPFSPNGAAAGGKWLVSGPLSGLPRWSADGRRLFYVSIATFGVTAVDVDTREGFRPGQAQRLFTAPPPLLPVGWSRAPDGRFLFVTTPTGGRTAPFTVVVNWAAALRQ